MNDFFRTNNKSYLTYSTYDTVDSTQEPYEVVVVRAYNRLPNGPQTVLIQMTRAKVRRKSPEKCPIFAHFSLLSKIIKTTVLKCHS